MRLRAILPGILIAMLMANTGVASACAIACALPAGHRACAGSASAMAVDGAPAAGMQGMQRCSMGRTMRPGDGAGAVTRPVCAEDGRSGQTYTPSEVQDGRYASGFLLVASFRPAPSAWLPDLRAVERDTSSLHRAPPHFLPTILRL